MSTNFSYQQLRRRQVEGEGTDEKRLSLDVCLARVMVPRYSAHCIMRNQATGCVYIQQGFQFLAEETMNGIPLKSVVHAGVLQDDSLDAAKNFAGNGTGLTNYQVVMATSIQTGGLQQFWVPKTVSQPQLLGSAPDFRLRYAAGAASKGLNIQAAAAAPGGAGAVPPTSTAVTQLFTDFINTSRFSAYNIQGRYTLDDYVIPKFAAKPTNEKNDHAEDGGVLLTFNFTSLYQNALRFQYDNQRPENNPQQTNDAKNYKASEIHRLNVLAHNEAGEEAGSYMTTSGMEDYDVTENIKTVMTRVYFDDFPPDGTPMNDVQKASLESFNDALRFRSYEIARRMVDDQRMWKMTNPFLGVMQSNINYPILFTSGPAQENYNYVRLIKTLKPDVVLDLHIFQEKVMMYDQQNANKFTILDRRNTAYGYAKVGGGAEKSFPLILPDYNVLGTFSDADHSIPTTLLNNLYAFQPLGLMDSGDNNGELVTVQSVGQRFFRPFIFEWEPNVVIDFNAASGLPENVTVMNVYPGKKDQDKFVESVFDRARYYSIVFVVVDDNKVQHYYAVTTYDYRAVPTLIQKFTSALRDGTMDTMKVHHVGENDPKQTVLDDDPNNNSSQSKNPSNDMEEFVRKLSVGASPVTPTEDAKKEKALLAPEFPLFPSSKGEIVMVPELLDVDAETAKDMYSEFVSSGGAQYDPSLAKSWGFLAKQPVEWANFLAGKLAAGNGNTTFSTFVKVPDLVACEEGSDPLPHSLRGISSANTTLSVGVTMREKFAADKQHAVVPIVHPGLLNVVVEVYKQGLFGPSATLHTITRASVLGAAIDDTKRIKTAQFMKSALPPDESWGIVLTTMNILNNMLSEEQLVRVKVDAASSRRNRLDSVIGYRRIAQRLLNSMPHLGKLERLEAYTAIEHDIFGKLMGVAQHRQDEVTQGVLQLGLGALRNYVAKQTGHDKASLDQAARAARQKMTVPPPRWQTDNFFIDGSNSNTDEIQLFIFKYDDNNTLPKMGHAGLLALALDVDPVEYTPGDIRTGFDQSYWSTTPTVALTDPAPDSIDLTNASSDEIQAVMYLVCRRIMKDNSGVKTSDTTGQTDFVIGDPATAVRLAASQASAAAWIKILQKGTTVTLDNTPQANKYSSILHTANAPNVPPFLDQQDIDTWKDAYLRTLSKIKDIHKERQFLSFDSIKDQFRIDIFNKLYNMDKKAGNIVDSTNKGDVIMSNSTETPQVDLGKARDHSKQQESGLICFVNINGNKFYRPMPLISKSRTLVYSKNTRALKIDDLHLSVAAPIIRKNLCEDKMEPGQGLGIVWMGTNHNEMSQTNLTTQLRQIFSAPSLEPLIVKDPSNPLKTNVFFKLPGARLVPSIKSFSHHMQYWNTKLGNNATMEKIYGDYQSSSFKYEEDEYNKNAGRFKTLFREDFNLTKDEMRQRASKVPLTLTTDNTGGQYRTRVISADHQITGGSTMDFKQNVTSRSEGSRVSTINKRLKELYGNNFGQEDFYS